MTSHLRGHRTESWRFELLSRDDEAPMGMLDGVQGGKITYSTGATYRSSGSLSWAGHSQPDWKTYRVRPWYRAVFDDGHVEEWPLGVFVLTTPGEDHDETGLEVEVDLYDKVFLLDQARIEESWSIDAGAQVTQWIRQWIMATPGAAARVQVEDSAETIRTPIVWEAGTTHLRIINDLARLINYNGVWADGWGTLRVEAHVPVSNRSEAWRFRRGEDCIYEGRFRRERDTASIPNKVILISTSDGETDALIGVATDESPESETSIPSRGYVMAVTETNVEASSQDVIDAMAVRRLADYMQSATTYRIAHAPLPIMGSERVQFVHDLHGIDARCVVQNVDLPLCQPGGMWTTTLREVVS